jgi:hypothetical protein
MYHEEETALIGWDQIGKVFGKTGNAVRKKYKDEFEKYNVTFRILVGTPPKPRVCCFPSRLKKYILLKSKQSKYV